jgi:hypothetical protein
VALCDRLLVGHVVRPAGRSWPEHGIPRSVLLDTTAIERLGVASPAVVPETIVVDHGKIFVSEHLTNVCRRMGISIQPGRLRTGRDKQLASDCAPCG